MILLFSRFPPPMGGVSRHVVNLELWLKSNDFDVITVDYNRNRDIIRIFKQFRSARIVHIHMSNKLYRFIILVISKFILNKRVLVTFHGLYDFSNFFDKCVLKLAHHNFVLNKKTLMAASVFRENNVSLISAYIPTQKNPLNSLDGGTIAELHLLKIKSKNIFCTNAWKLVRDSTGNEVYGGSTLFEIFLELPDSGLIFSDPQGQYKEFYLRHFGDLPANIVFISYEHDFLDVIPYSKAFIRSTNTDGDAVSVHEALNFGIDVIASNVVDRPNGTILYETVKELKRIIINFNTFEGNFYNYKLNSYTDTQRRVYIENLEKSCVE